MPRKSRGKELLGWSVEKGVKSRFVKACEKEQLNPADQLSVLMNAYASATGFPAPTPATKAPAVAPAPVGTPAPAGESAVPPGPA